MINCSICINTYKRPFLLKKLLDSINDQVVDGDIQIEIIVVDNDPEKQAESIVTQTANYLKYPICYFTQPIKNISLTRNVAVKHATGEFILFIDDDGYADKLWVKNMLNCSMKYNADAVFGRVIPYFDEETPEWIKKGGFFERDCPPTGQSPEFTRTGNCLIKADLLKSVDGPFDPEYGLTGGSDTHLFTSLLKKEPDIFRVMRGLSMIMFILTEQITNGFFKDLSGQEIPTPAE